MRRARERRERSHARARASDASKALRSTHRKYTWHRSASLAATRYPEGGPYLEPRSSKWKPGVVHEPERFRVDTVIQVINISGKRIELSRPLSSSTGSIGEGRTVGTHANGELH